jgi:hypothetical protein
VGDEPGGRRGIYDGAKIDIKIMNRTETPTFMVALTDRIENV